MDGFREGTARIIEHRNSSTASMSMFCLATAAMDNPDGIINLADTKPAAQGDAMRHAAGLLGVVPPVQTLEEANLRPWHGAVSRRVASKIIGPSWAGA